MAALLVPLLLVAPIMGAQTACTGEPLDSANAGDAYVIRAGGNGWWNHGYYLPPLITVNWD